jgi:drug/metabolite transporter (DMT)-like permease
MILAAFIWGSGHPVGKIILREITAQQLTLLSSMFSGITLVIWLTLTRKARNLMAIRGRALVLTLTSGAIMFFLYPNLSFSALRLIPASANSILVATSTIFVALLAVIFLKEKLHARGYLGILISFVGIALVIISTESNTLNVSSLSVLGSVLALFAAVASALYAIVGRRLARYDALCVTMLGAAFGSILQGLMLSTMWGFTEILRASPETYLLVAYWGIFSGLGYVAYYYCLGRIEAARVASFIFLSPLFATILSSLTLGEQLTAPFLGGLALTLAGIWVTQASKPSNPH